MEMWLGELVPHGPEAVAGRSRATERPQNEGTAGTANPTPQPWGGPPGTYLTA